MSDFDVVRQYMEKVDIWFDGVIEIVEGMVKIVIFFDLDGNVLMFVEDFIGNI